MAASPKWKVYTSAGEYIGSVKHPMYGAMLLAGMGDRGATLRQGHGVSATVWTDGIDGEAAESFDAVVHTVLERTDPASLLLRK